MVFCVVKTWWECPRDFKHKIEYKIKDYVDSPENKGATIFNTISDANDYVKKCSPNLKKVTQDE